ncbi:MAG: hypothetical protein ACI8X3_001151, partial [Saprospiraceae bacterium]
MRFKKGITFTFCLLISAMIFGQFSRFHTEVFDGTDKLDHAFVGGLISPEFSAIDLN